MTGKEMWYVAPIRPVRTMKQPAIEYPIQTQSHDCHHEIPSTPLIAEDDIIHVFWQGESAVIPEAAFPSHTMLKESATQKPTKFQGPH